MTERVCPSPRGLHVGDGLMAVIYLPLQPSHVRGHEEVPGYGQLRSPLVATRSARFWSREVPTPH